MVGTCLSSSLRGKGLHPATDQPLPILVIPWQKLGHLFLSCHILYIKSRCRFSNYLAVPQRILGTVVFCEGWNYLSNLSLATLTELHFLKREKLDKLVQVYTFPPSLSKLHIQETLMTFLTSLAVIQYPHNFLNQDFFQDCSTFRPLSCLEFLFKKCR